MEKDNQGSRIEVEYSADITLTMQQLDAVINFFGTASTLASAIDFLNSIPPEGRQQFMDSLVQQNNQDRSL